MKFSLNAVDRLAFSTLLPEGSSGIERSLIIDIEKKVALSQKELAEIGYVPGANGKVSVEPDKTMALVVEFEFTNPEIVYLQKRTKWADEHEGVTNTNYNIWTLIQGASVSG